MPFAPLNRVARSCTAAICTAATPVVRHLTMMRSVSARVDRLMPKRRHCPRPAIRAASKPPISSANAASAAALKYGAASLVSGINPQLRQAD